MTLSGFDAALYTTLFVLPGFISYAVILKLVPMRRKTDSANVLAFLSLTAVNYAIWFVPLRISLEHKWMTAAPGWTALFWIVVLMVSPALIGFLAGAAVQKRWLDNCLGRMGLACVDPVPTAWDWVSAKKRRNGSS